MNVEEQTKYLGNETWVGFVNGQVRIITDLPADTPSSSIGVSSIDIILEPYMCQKLFEFFKLVGVLDE